MFCYSGARAKPASPESITLSAAEYGFRARRFAASRNDGFYAAFFFTSLMSVKTMPRARSAM